VENFEGLSTKVDSIKIKTVNNLGYHFVNTEIKRLLHNKVCHTDLDLSGEVSRLFPGGDPSFRFAPIRVTF